MPNAPAEKESLPGLQVGRSDANSSSRLHRAACTVAAMPIAVGLRDDEENAACNVVKLHEKLEEIVNEPRRRRRQKAEEADERAAMHREALKQASDAARKRMGAAKKAVARSERSAELFAACHSRKAKAWLIHGLGSPAAGSWTHVVRTLSGVQVES